jgi:hypothetical protein
LVSSNELPPLTDAELLNLDVPSASSAAPASHLPLPAAVAAAANVPDNTSGAAVPSSCKRKSGSAAAMAHMRPSDVYARVMRAQNDFPGGDRCARAADILVRCYAAAAAAAALLLLTRAQIERPLTRSPPACGRSWATRECFWRAPCAQIVECCFAFKRNLQSGRFSSYGAPFPRSQAHRAPPRHA